MSSTSKNIALLPNGFEDLLPDAAEAEYGAIATLMQVFSQFGYRRIKPPLAEFEQSLLAAGPGAALVDDTFRMMDPLSHKMLGLRSDITAQIARIASSRMGDELRPLRLTYANDVIRTRASQARTQRQFTQVGCEMIGQDDVDCDVEICVVALMSLAALGLENITLDFALPRIADEIFVKTKTQVGDVDALRLSLSGAGDKVFDALAEMDLSDESQKHISRLKAVIKGVNAAIAQLDLKGVTLTVDPLETQGFEYHTTLAFTFFAQNVRGEIGRGGRYDIGNSLESAAGFTFYMDTLRRGLPERGGEKIKRISTAASWADIQSYQNEGFIVIRESRKDA